MSKKRLVTQKHHVPELDPEGDMFVPSTLRNNLPVKRDRRDRWREVAAMSYPATNGYGDPLSVFLLTQTLTQLRPDQTVYAAGLAELLNERCPQIRWDGVTVGRILSNLQAIAEIRRAQNHDPVPAIERRHSRNGLYYHFYSATDTWRFLHDVMTHVANAAAEAVRYAREGVQPPSRMEDVFEGFEEKAA